MKTTYGASTYLATVTSGQHRGVAFDSHSPIFNNLPPVTFISGSPGSGKTFCGLNIVAKDAILGKTVIVLDYKGDFLCLANLKQELGNINVWDLSSKRSCGVLDPFRLSDDAGKQLNLAISAIEIFTGGLSDNQLTVLSPIVQDIIKSSEPSLMNVVESLRSSTREVARDLGTKLDIIRKLPYAKVAFAPPGQEQEKVDINRGVTIISLAGMDMPKTQEEMTSTNTGRLASGVLFLIMQYIQDVMGHSKSFPPKTLFIDEAWSVLSSKAGGATVKAVALLGRSKNMALIIATQNITHLDGIDINSTISTRFAFRTSKEESAAICDAMDLPKDEGFEGILTGLGQGECLMQDFQNRHEIIHIEGWNKEWNKAFETNPLQKLQEEKKRRAQEKKARRLKQRQES